MNWRTGCRQKRRSTRCQPINQMTDKGRKVWLYPGNGKNSSTGTVSGGHPNPYTRLRA